MNLEESERQAAQLIEHEKYHEAQLLLTAISDQGSVYALEALAWINENGRTGNKDRKAARFFYEQAISRGSTDALLDLGLLLLKEGRQSEARTVFEQGAGRGHLGCLGELGWMLANGIGGDSCKAEGLERLEEAANRGHLFTRRRMISLELSGRPSFMKRIALFGRLLAVAWNTFLETYRNRRSDKIW
jgi:TPR repeat protein